MNVKDSMVMGCSGLPVNTFQVIPRRIIFPMLPRNCETCTQNSDVISTILKTPSTCSQNVGITEHSGVGVLVKSSSIESDIPSLASLSSNSEQGSLSVGSYSDVSFSDRRACSNSNSRHWNSKKKHGEGKSVCFSPHIWVHEFQRSEAEKEAVWFTAEEMSNFKDVAIQCIIAHNSKSSRNVAGKAVFYNQGGAGKVLYSHPALGVDGEHHPAFTYRKRGVTTRFTTVSQLRINQFRDAIAETEVRNILIVNSHDVFLKLFAKGMRKMFPYAMITAARAREDALMHIEERRSKKKGDTNIFDVVVIEEKPKKTCSHEDDDETLTGTRLLFDITKVYCSPNASMKALFVGVCSDTKTEILKFKAHGADFVWRKPPPLMDDSLRDTILRSLLIKRGRISIVKKLF
jgi:hypothetical protein